VPLPALQLELESMVVLASAPFSGINAPPLKIGPAALNRPQSRERVVSQYRLLNAIGPVSNIRYLECETGR
jgi:hypothetical protein